LSILYTVFIENASILSDVFAFFIKIVGIFVAYKHIVVSIQKSENTIMDYALMVKSLFCIN